MARKTDAVTGWWRSISLRAKVTGVSVAVLAVGLLAAGIGTTAFLRNALAANVDSQVEQLATSDVVAPLLDLTVEDGMLIAVPTAKPPPTDYFVAIYEGVDGDLIAVDGGRGGPEPDFPDRIPLDKAITLGSPFSLSSVDGETEYRAAATVQELARTSNLYTQVVAVPLASVNRTIATYLGIYSIIAVITIVAGALLTRWLVTLAFRSLGQVETTAMAIAGGDFSQRMTDIEPTTEVGRLKTAINTMLGRVDAAISQRDATVRQMRRFIGDASHELRTPLVTVRGYAELYRMGAIAGEDDVAQAMERIEKEAVRMGVLVEDLLALARLDERRDVAFAPVDLRPIARDAALDMRAPSPHRSVTVIDTTAREPDPPEDDTTHDTEPVPRPPTTSAIARAGATLSRLRRRPRPAPVASDVTPPAGAVDEEHDVETPTEPIVLGDENRIRQVVANLLGNARRFSPEDSPIELRVGVDPTSAMGWIEVIDHGEGIPDQIKDKIFQRFWRADSSRTRETGGTGLGLSIVASIVEALHGAVAVTDTPGGGATFRISIPLAQVRSRQEQLSIRTQPIDKIVLDEEH
ncbi:HAMP domain-containing sensor histidine kinase [Microbacterium awajiense]|uniref:sensor histidine kinase n=1 Tax=Microbacterium awajiense TaxID=415214 RepID=UPI0031DEC58A